MSNSQNEAGNIPARRRSNLCGNCGQTFTPKAFGQGWCDECNEAVRQAQAGEKCPGCGHSGQVIDTLCREPLRWDESLGREELCLHRCDFSAVPATAPCTYCKPHKDCRSDCEYCAAIIRGGGDCVHAGEAATEAVTERVTCASCKGTGHVLLMGPLNVQCKYCDGTGLRAAPASAPQLKPPERIWIQHYDKYAGGSGHGFFYFKPFKMEGPGVEYVRADLARAEPHHTSTLGQIVIHLLQEHYEEARELANKVKLNWDGELTKG